jgi:pyrimidine-nucleoside phosphorylase
VALGAGRAKKSDPIDHAVGFVIHTKVGDKVGKGDPLFTIHANNEESLAEARDAVLAAHSFSDDLVEPLPLFYT